MPPSQVGAFARSNPDVATPNVEFHVQPLSLDRFGEPLHTFPAFTTSICNLRPTSRGSIHAASPDPMAGAAASTPITSPPTRTGRSRSTSLRLARRIVEAAAIAALQAAANSCPGRI
jgi:choline dehydrogenase